MSATISEVTYFLGVGMEEVGWGGEIENVNPFKWQK